MTQLYRPDSKTTGEFRVYVNIDGHWWPMTWAMDWYQATALGGMLCHPWKLVEMPSE